MQSRDSATFDIDAEGFFEGEPLWNGDVYPGSGVKFIAWDESHRHVYGRADADTKKTAVWQTLPDVGFVPETIEFAKGTDSHRVEALAALSRQVALRHPVVRPPDPREDGLRFFSLDESPLRAFVAAVGGAPAAPATSVRGPSPVAADGGSPRDPVAGLDLSAWVPARGGVFVRFRSVQGAYRVLDELDHCAAAALAVTDENARDHGTLRLVLHDLLLPTIWRTNPESERGVGEVAVFVLRPLRRGRIEAAAILRVTDPELHRMQTEAGIADEARPEHLWRPADDPFPDERSRRNFRRRVADVEIVATNAVLLERIAERRFAELVEDTGYQEVRWGAPGASRSAPAPEEAAFCYDSVADTPKLRECVTSEFQGVEREAAGLDWLLRRWLGDAVAPVVLGTRQSWLIGMGHVRCCRLTTDARGMAVELRYTSPVFASDAQELIGEMQPANVPNVTAARTTSACLHNLEDLVPLALVENPQDDVAERNFVVLGWKPVCPCGGTYSVHPITREVSCSVHGTVKSPKTAPWTPPPISDVKVEGTELSFRLAIDWNRQR